MTGEFTDWKGIDYNPVAQVLPSGLIRHLVPGMRILDIGCNKGGVALHLARQGFSVLGIDINQEAIEHAQDEAQRLGLEARTKFQREDATDHTCDSGFDVVMLIRVLTCIPDPLAWRRVLENARNCVKHGGLMYVNDFVMDVANPHYSARYQDGRNKGWTEGSFEVVGEQGPIFIAHHHTEREVEEIAAPYAILELRQFQALSMNGNGCTMFEFIGRK